MCAPRRVWSLVAVLIVVLVTACSGQAPLKPTSGSLYNQLGRMDGIDATVESFIFASVRNETLNPAFKGMSFFDYFRLKYNFVQQMCEIAGGPCRYTGRSMIDSHKGLNITVEQFIESGRLFDESMKKNGVGNNARQTMLQRLGPMQNEIVGQ